MFKFILLVIALFLLLRLVLGVLKFGLRVFTTGFLRSSAHRPESFSSDQNIEETDYEVIDSHLKDNEQKIGS
ncbi:MAG: hypothetical protein WCL43_07270 [Chlorobium sp.]|nr:MAG: hypothetical protein FDX12_07580 [Chlorobium sp.]